MDRYKIIIRLKILIAFIFLCSIEPAFCLELPAHKRPSAEGPKFSTSDKAPLYSYALVNTYPHDRRAFTQGLSFADGFLYEGTGIYGKSALKKIIPETGIAIKGVNLPEQLFGEGVTLSGDRIIQLTWKAGTGFVYDKESLRLLWQFKYNTEGWGLANDGSRLIMSDGTNNLYFLSPLTFERTGQIKVHDGNIPINKLNELEYVRGRIYANVWQSDRIAIINPDTGHVTAWINLEGLSRRAGGDNVYKTLNGIAYDPEHDRLFVTGKLWPEIYEIKIIPTE